MKSTAMKTQLLLLSLGHIATVYDDQT